MFDGFAGGMEGARMVAEAVDDGGVVDGPDVKVVGDVGGGWRRFAGGAGAGAKRRSKHRDVVVLAPGLAPTRVRRVGLR